MDFSTLYNLLASQWGYVGIFLVELLSYSTVLLPVPGLAIAFLYGSILNPMLVGLIGGLGAAIGELTGYFVGYAGHKMIIKKNRKITKDVQNLLKRYNPFFVIIFLGALPFPFDVMGVLCGLSKYDLKKYFVATYIGHTIKLVVLALAGFYGVHWILRIFSF
ncbi:MAG: VTT domain-containing protein [Candidatus Aenigmatarchaeota archaeon]